MSHIFSSKKVKSAIDMSRYGIGVVVLTEHESLEKMMRDYAFKPDKIWCDGLGKKHLHKMLQKQLSKEDKYFDKNKNEINRNSQRWTNFMDNCVIYATLSSYLFDEPLYLIHPQSYKKAIASAPLNATSGELPTLIDDVYVLR
jgi:hypothetical protein